MSGITTNYSKVFPVAEAEMESSSDETSSTSEDQDIPRSSLVSTCLNLRNLNRENVQSKKLLLEVCIQQKVKTHELYARIHKQILEISALQQELNETTNEKNSLTLRNQTLQKENSLLQEELKRQNDKIKKMMRTNRKSEREKVKLLQQLRGRK